MSIFDNLRSPADPLDGSAVATRGRAELIYNRYASVSRLIERQLLPQIAVAPLMTSASEHANNLMVARTRLIEPAKPGMTPVPTRVKIFMRGAAFAGVMVLPSMVEVALPVQRAHKVPLPFSGKPLDTVQIEDIEQYDATKLEYFNLLSTEEQGVIEEVADLATRESPLWTRPRDQADVRAGYIAVRSTLLPLPTLA